MQAKFIITHKNFIALQNLKSTKKWRKESSNLINFNNESFQMSQKIHSKAIQWFLKKYKKIIESYVNLCEFFGVAFIDVMSKQEKWHSIDTSCRVASLAFASYPAEPFFSSYLLTSMIPSTESNQPPESES